MRVCSMTDIGVKREMNQDYLYSSEEAIGDLPNLFVVADGMGGHKGGEFASSHAVDTIVNTIRTIEKKDHGDILADGILAANQMIKTYADTHEGMRGMGTTTVACTINGHRLTVANVGDSRLYLISNDEIRQVTQDHSLVQEMVRMGEMDPERAANHPDKNIITRAVGVDRFVDVDLFEEILQPGQIIMMCSDGLTNMVSEDKILSIMKEDADLESRTERLVETANSNGGKDNITVIMIDPEVDEVNVC